MQYCDLYLLCVALSCACCLWLRTCCVWWFPGPSPVKGGHLKITQPHTPQLMTRQRSRPTLLKSTATLEAEEAEKMHKYVLAVSSHS